MDNYLMVFSITMRLILEIFIVGGVGLLSFTSIMFIYNRIRINRLKRDWEPVFLCQGIFYWANKKAIIGLF